MTAKEKARQRQAIRDVCVWFDALLSENRELREQGGEADD